MTEVGDFMDLPVMAAGTRVAFQGAPPTPLGRLELGGAVVGGRGLPSAPLRVLGSHAVVVCVSGGVYEDAAGTRAQLAAGDAVVVFPELPHRYGPRRGGRWDEFFVVFDGPVFELLRRVGVLDPRRPVLPRPSSEWVQRVAAFVDRPRAATAAAGCAEVAELAGLLAETGAGVHDRGGWLARARSLLDADLAAPLDLQGVAAELGMSAERFRKRFAQQGGEPPGRYRARRRLESAGVLLRQTTLTHRQIALSVGYADEFHLARAFRRATGRTPSAHRAAAHAAGD